MYIIDEDLITKIKIAQQLANKSGSDYALCFVSGQWHVERLDTATALGRDVIEIIRPI